VLNDEQRHALVAYARRAVSARVTGQSPPAYGGVAVPPASGVFVTLKSHGELRGCLGTLDSPIDLVEEVCRCAGDAATRDPRFPAVQALELSSISLELSVLAPLEPIDPTADGAIVVGRHGLVVEQDRRRGLLLPQVATEWSWNVEQFLCQTCLKANLPRDAWLQGATVYRFEAEVFGE
jgi:AmmeMemoRadiSam system protein A